MRAGEARPMGRCQTVAGWPSPHWLSQSLVGRDAVAVRSQNLGQSPPWDVAVDQDAAQVQNAHDRPDATK